MSYLEPEPKFDTEKPPQSITLVHMRAGAGAVPEIRVNFGNNPEAARPFLDWLATTDAWAAFGDWYDSGNWRKYEGAHNCECGKPVPDGAWARGYRTCRDHLSDIAEEPRFDRAAEKAGA